MTNKSYRPLTVKPIVSYPHEALTGKTYLMTVDLEGFTGWEAWDYEEEEYSVYCMIESIPGSMFTSEPIDEPAVVLHRFGGTYGPAKFLLTASEDQKEGTLKIQLVNKNGLPMKVLDLHARVVAPETAQSTAKVGDVSLAEVKRLFDRQLASGIDTLSLAAFRNALSNAQDDLKQQYARSVPITALVASWASLIDQILVKCWKLHGLPQGGLALVAVGGYGRGELHPGSDISIQVLFDASAVGDEIKHRIEMFIKFLVGIGLKVKHSIHTIEQCKKHAEADVTIATSLMDSRLMAGEASLFEAMRRAIGPDSIWPAREFFEAKLEEQITRHRKFGDTAYNLEPNLKEGPGLTYPHG